ncbi:MAG: squalene synthase HpnD [Candidatus Cloacimonetes bacterium 4572_55]|nr:MAG: squalene synthase HpnD [Candidatus Cloacimonetes bacterium 4572_55]
MNPQEYVKSYTRSSGSNFYYSFLLLPKAKREAMFSIYAFCKYTDDLVDEEQPGGNKQQLLNNWRGEIRQMYEGRPIHPITQSLAASLDKFPIPQKYFDDLVDGIEMDLKKNRYVTFDELLQYCYRVASAVGLMSIEIFGYSCERTRQYARHLGVAFQLTNIIRDIKSDAERDRIYIPLEDLNRFSYTECDLLNSHYSRAFINLMSFQVLRAKEYFQRASRTLPLIDKSTMVTAEIMSHIYFRILEKIEHVHYNVFKEKISLSKSVKIGIALSAYLLSRVDSMFGSQTQEKYGNI